MMFNMLAEESLQRIPVLVYANKQDLPNCLSVEEIEQELELNRLREMNGGRHVFCQACCGPSGDGLREGLDWLVDILRHPNQQPVQQIPSEIKEPSEEDRMVTQLNEWLERTDEDDDEFLAKLDDYTLENWDHRTHLRIAFIFLSRYGRREGMKLIFSKIKAYIENSDRTKRNHGTTFHETMTYFWVHMVHYGMELNKVRIHDFRSFLLMNPHFVNGGLFLHYYTKQLMLNNAESRMTVILPDKCQLPSIITYDASATTISDPAEEKTMTVTERVPKAPLTDEEFLDAIMSEGGENLPGWGHEYKLRAIYLLINYHKRSGLTRGSSDILEQLKKVEKQYTHETINYFWIQMVTFHIAKELKQLNYSQASGITRQFLDMTFDAFIRLPHCQTLRNQLLIDKYV
jgi:hypothetical protein